MLRSAVDTFRTTDVDQRHNQKRSEQQRVKVFIVQTDSAVITTQSLFLVFFVLFFSEILIAGYFDLYTKEHLVIELEQARIYGYNPHSVYEYKNSTYSPFKPYQIFF